ncbi:glycosyl hydrolase [Portibacter lacus]|uniref:beta-N-acetylhexosaminidase n=2 Tax=Portibacter lacus TaxID=1099794 RepID=A0AA37SQB8_9BACT|nr:glycosyl hydrolase [Portibacter lacus]
MIGQMIMIGFRGMNIDEVSESVKTSIKDEKVGGIILFDYDVVKKEAKRNISSPGQLKTLIADIQNLSDTPLFMAVDQEGGRVNRLKTKYGFPKSVSNKYLGTLDDVDSTKFYAHQNADLLSRMGFNVNFAPDVDLEINPTNPVIGKIERSYGPDVETVTKHAGIWIDEHNKKSIISVLKHFPGHGSSDADSHLGVTDITKYWSEIELEPFKALAPKKRVAIMTAHVLNTNLDSVPATLSEKIIKKILREDWEFDGLLFSDDLHMAAVNAMYDFDNIIEMSLNAGVDVFVFGNNLKYDEDIPNKVIESVSKMVKSGAIEESRIKASYDRIMREKAFLN